MYKLAALFLLSLAIAAGLRAQDPDENLTVEQRRARQAAQAEIQRQ